MSHKYQAVIIGSGFGGAIAACRLAKKWPDEVLVLERGKRYPLGSFPRSPREMAGNFWYDPADTCSRPGHLSKHTETLRGMFDVRAYKHMDVVIGAGLGGGSLIYANVFMKPPPQVFDDRWPDGCKRDDLDPYMDIAKEVLGARPLPDPGDDERRELIKLGLFQETAKQVGRKSELVDINVFFGNDFEKPLPMGTQAENRYGALQSSCVYCAECDIGCNWHAKNTLDLNYLYVAEHRYKATIWTEHLAQTIVPLDKQGKDDPSADGSFGYRLEYRNLQTNEVASIITERVVVSAGSLGSTEFLLRCKHGHKRCKHGHKRCNHGHKRCNQAPTLPNLSDALGKGFSGNGDFLAFVLQTDKKHPVDPNRGPVITQRIDYNLFEEFNREHAFIIEDASYPIMLAWLLEGIKPRGLWFWSILRVLKDTFRKWILGRPVYGPVGNLMQDILDDELSSHTAVLLCMGVDKSNGTMSLNKHGDLNLDWPIDESGELYEAMVAAAKQFGRRTGAKDTIPLPTYNLPGKNITVHALGGCRLADDAERGVTSAAPETFGQTFGYKKLYVSDGALAPTAVGSNPIATITALAERVAEGITGNKPDADL